MMGSAAAAANSPCSVVASCGGALKYAVPAIVLSVFPLTPFVLATIAVVRGASSSTTTSRSALCAGRVWHTRFLPVKHAFQYPLFIFCLDLEEVERRDDHALFSRIWPLSLVVAFRESDHLKNGEGMMLTQTNTTGKQIGNNSLSERVFRLVSERTEGKFQPTADSHRILLITHLQYFGYNFNPVSFYILQSKTDNESTISAVVGEVSNTPWNEMYCYVLHPDSVDQVKVVAEEDSKPETTEPSSSSSSSQKQQNLRYIFPKNFHVSPFMEMNYNYEWFFWNFSTTEPHAATIRIINNLRQQNNNADDDATLQFTAKMLVRRYSMHPFRIAWHVATFPVYCAILQVWIHYEAFRLLAKGVAFQPHPQGSETVASRWIGNLMKPFFAVQAWWEKQRDTGSTRKLA